MVPLRTPGRPLTPGAQLPEHSRPQPLEKGVIVQCCERIQENSQEMETDSDRRAWGCWALGEDPARSQSDTNPNPGLTPTPGDGVSVCDVSLSHSRSPSDGSRSNTAYHLVILTGNVHTVRFVHTGCLPEAPMLESLLEAHVCEQAPCTVLIPTISTLPVKASAGLRGRELTGRRDLSVLSPGHLVKPPTQPQHLAQCV